MSDDLPDEALEPEARRLATLLAAEVIPEKHRLPAMAALAAGFLPFILAFAKRAREPLEKDRDSWKLTAKVEKAAAEDAERLHDGAAQLARERGLELDSLRAQLAEAVERAEAAEAKVRDCEAEHPMEPWASQLQARVEEMENGIQRIRDNWPHIEIPSGKFFADTRTQDPGAPACLRCRIEQLILGPREAALARPEASTPEPVR